MLFIATNHEQNGLGHRDISQYHFTISVCNYLVSFTLRSQLSCIFFPTALEGREEYYASNRKIFTVSHKSRSTVCDKPFKKQEPNTRNAFDFNIQYSSCVN